LIVATSVRELGGLHIVGTERHESRRIDNQLRGRCGRQGDPGSSRFFLSLDDDLMRIFAPEWVAKIMKTMGLTDGQEIEHRMVSNAIERAQKKVESHHFDIRKNLLEYDEVMDKQRKIIYEQRDNILKRQDLQSTVMGMIGEAIERLLETHYSDEMDDEEKDVETLCQIMEQRYGIKVYREEFYHKPFEEAYQFLIQKAEEALQKKTNVLGKESIEELMCFVLLQVIDTKWKDHLYAMDVLRSGVGLEGMGGKDPKMEYKRQGFSMFEMMKEEIASEVTQFIFLLKFEEKLSQNLKGMGEVSNESHLNFEQPASREREYTTNSKEATPPKPIKRKEPKVGRNDPCSCGSGKKYKKCCGSSKV
jgi:preprotein translocase subunit SecA